MREIKFRVWDDKYSTMINNNKQALEIIADGTEVPNFFKPMQYTGLKDKNGVETYESDIVKPIKGKLLRVVFHDGGFRLARATKRMKIVGNIFPNNTKLEVIGNIHQNPELLETT